VFLGVREPPALAAARLALTADPDGRALRVGATNAGGEAARDVRPEVVYRHRRTTGDAVRLDPGTHQVWTFDVEPPVSGAFPAIVRVHWQDVAGHARATPLVVAVPSDVPTGTVTIRTEPSRIGRNGSVPVVLENTGAEPVTGRVLLVLPAGLTTEPEALPAHIAGHSRARVTTVVQNDGELPPDRYPVFAVLEYDEAAVHRTVVAATMVDVEVPAGARVPLVVGAIALAGALGLLAIAWRASRGRRGDGAAPS
jgi:hypothetical protein